MQIPVDSKLLELFCSSLEELFSEEDGLVSLDELSTDEEDFAELEDDFSLEELSSTFSLLLDSTGFSELEDTSFFSELEDSSTFTELEDSAAFIELDDSSTLAELEESSTFAELLLDFALLLDLSFWRLEEIPVSSNDRIESFVLLLDTPVSLLLDPSASLRVTFFGVTLDEDSSQPSQMLDEESVTSLSAGPAGDSLEPSSPQALPSNAATTTILPRTNFFNIKTSPLNIT